MKANLKFWFSSIATILIGVLFFMRGAGALDLMVKVFAGILAVSGIISFITLAWLRGIVKLVLGVALWIIDWQSYARIALYIVGGLVILYAVMGLWNFLRSHRMLLLRLAGLVSALICLAFGWFLIFGQGVVAVWVFKLTGVALVISGFLSLIGRGKKRD
jgi:hypothetical protein